MLLYIYLILFIYISCKHIYVIHSLCQVFLHVCRLIEMRLFLNLMEYDNGENFPFIFGAKWKSKFNQFIPAIPIC